MRTLASAPPKTRRAPLRDIVGSIISHHPTRKAIKKLFCECHGMAVAHLCQQIQRGQLPYQIANLPVRDLALDCIADLFERDSAGRFVQLATYFESEGWSVKSSTELRLLLRRLVVSKVHEGLFRHYREIDPALSKVIRNLKIAVKADPRVELTRKARRLWLVTADSADTPSAQPPAPFELLQAHLAGALARDNTAPAAIESFLDFTHQYDMYADSYPLSRFAQAVRAAMTNRHDPEFDEAGMETAASYRRAELNEVLEYVTDAIKTDKLGTYVASGKVEMTTFNAYLDAVRDVLLSSFSSDAEQFDSHYDALANYMSTLTHRSYQDEHRNVFEYLTKISRQRLVSYLRDDLAVAG